MSKMSGSGNPELNFVIKNFNVRYLFVFRPTPLDPDLHPDPGPNGEKLGPGSGSRSA